MTRFSPERVRVTLATSQKYNREGMVIEDSGTVVKVLFDDDAKEEWWERGSLVTLAGSIGDPSEVDAVNHPPHYTSHPSRVECIQVVEHMTFNVGNAVKYCWRAGLKVDPELAKGGNAKKAIIQDLQKARWYLDREIQRLEKEASS